MNEFPNDVSPVPTQDEDDVHLSQDDKTSDVSAAVQPSTFFDRIKHCASDPMPMAHLSFMRTNKTPTSSVKGNPPRVSGGFTPPVLCGKPDIIVEEVDSSPNDQRDPSSDTRRTASLSMSSLKHRK